MEFLFSSLGDDAELAEIVELFVAEMPGRVELLERHLAAADWKALSRAAHQLKGAAGSYGFAAITPYAARVEAAANDVNQHATVAVAVQELIDLCRRTRACRGASVASP
jgi:HPt (histidine-containing phosphotransfer) domain-containing protein